MKIITCASYFGSGSSALTDLVAEYDSVKDLTDYEFRFLHDIDGVSDLEFHLVECHNRHNAGHALKRFKKLSKFNAGKWFNSRFEPFFDNKYMKLTNEYIDELVDFQYKGWWFYDIFDKGPYRYYFYSFMDKILKKITFGKRGILRKEYTLCAHPSEEKFLEATKKYTSALMRAANKENKPYLEIDQLVPSQNINRVLRYFEDDVYVFVVDRDPRDVYALAKYVWGYDICPTGTVEEFCDWFLYNRKSGKKEVLDEKKVIKIRFEDLIYKYDETKARIEEFVGLTGAEHTAQFAKFNPKRSVHNTKIWTKYCSEGDIKVIEERLSEYLYPFDEVEKAEIKGIDVNETTAF